MDPNSSARFAKKWQKGLKNRLAALWNQPAFLQEVFRIHRLSPTTRSAHGMGGQVMWGRGFFGEHILADATQEQQLLALVPFDRKEAALFGLAADALCRADDPLLVAIGAESSHRCQGFAQLSRIYRATLLLCEPLHHLRSKFLYESKLNGGIDPAVLRLSPFAHSPSSMGQCRNRVKASPLAPYLRARGFCQTRIDLDKGRQKTRALIDEAIGRADFVWVESGENSLSLTMSLCSLAPSSTPILLRLAPRLFAKKALENWYSSCLSHQRAPHTLPEGSKRSLEEINAQKGTLWLALI